MDVLDIIQNPLMFQDTFEKAKLELEDEQKKKKTERKNAIQEIITDVSSNVSQNETIVFADPGPAVSGDLSEILLVDDLTVKIENMRQCFIASFNERIEYEQSKSNCTSQMIVNLRNVCKQFTTNEVCHVFVALNLDDKFVNRQISANSRFNVYAFSKVLEIAFAMQNRYIHTKTLYSFLKSLVLCREANVAFTYHLQVASLSKAFRVARWQEAYLQRQDLSKATAKAQRSQLIATLDLFGVIANNQLKSEKNVIVLKDNPVTRQIIKMLD